jgi:hypothetical protein
MDINTLLSERMTFNNFIFSMSFPDIVNYLERNPSAMSKVEWDLFTNSKIRTSKNIDSYPELILKHSNWPWRFNIKQIQDELSRKISELSRLSKSKTTKPSLSSVSSSKVSNDNWIDKVINSMEKLCEIQEKIKVQDSQIIINEIKQEQKQEKKQQQRQEKNSFMETVVLQIATEEMPPDDIDEIKVEKFLHESDDESDDFEEEDPRDTYEDDSEEIFPSMNSYPMDSYCNNFGFFKK